MVSVRISWVNTLKGLRTMPITAQELNEHFQIASSLFLFSFDSLSEYVGNFVHDHAMWDNCA